MGTDSQLIDTARIDKLFQGLGICLHHYQQIEHWLKFLLPQMANPDVKVEPRTDFDWRKLLDSRTTLGPLLEELKDKVKTDNPDGFADYLATLVNQRNDLVHHFFTDHNRPLRSPDDLERAIDLVRQYMRHASPLARALEEMAAQFVNHLSDQGVDSTRFESFVIHHSANSTYQ